MKIKNAFIIILFLVLVAKTSKGQIMIGPVAGGQLSSIRFDEKENNDLYKVKPIWGYHAGAHVSFRVRKRFTIHSSFLYSTKGKVIEGKEDKLLHNKVVFKYIDVPIIYTVDFKAKFGNGKEFKYYLGIGPNISYWLGGKGKFTDSNYNELSLGEQSYSVVFKKAPLDVKDNEMNVTDPNRIQLGINLAAGLLIEPFGYQKFLLMARYEFGHSFLSKSGGGDFTQTYYQDVLRARNQGLRLSLAYLIDLKVETRKKGKSTIRKSRL